MELEKEFKLGTQQVIELYNELTDFLDMNRNSMGSRDYPSIRVFIEDLVNGWVNNIKESEYYIDPEGISEYMNTDQDIEDQIQYMKATAIGPFHYNLVSIGLVRLIINEILENGK